MCICVCFGERDELLVDSYFSVFHPSVDGNIIYDLGNIGSCLFGNKCEVFGFGLVEFEVPVKSCGNV